MIALPLLVSAIGVFTAGLSAFSYVSGSEASGIAGMIIGTGLFALGILVFLTNSVMKVIGRGFGFSMRGRFYSFEVNVQAHLGGSAEESGANEENSHVLRKSGVDDNR